MSEFELSAPNAIRRAAVINDPELVQARLQKLHPDLTTALIRNVITVGLSGRNEVTPASAPTAAGVQQWLYTVQELRTLLSFSHWHIHQHQNCPFISSPDRTVSIVVMTGNSETGKLGEEDPTNQAEKGAVAENFVTRNRQLELFNNQSLTLARNNQQGTQVWALLYHYDKGLNEVRYELSLPTGFSKKKITDWGERIVLGSIPNTANDFIVSSDDPDTLASIDVQVEPKENVF